MKMIIFCLCAKLYMKWGFGLFQGHGELSLELTRCISRVLSGSALLLVS